MGDLRNEGTFLYKNLKVKGYLKYLGVDGMTILKWRLRT
jgi:hypothetical protein